MSPTQITILSILIGPGALLGLALLGVKTTPRRKAHNKANELPSIELLSQSWGSSTDYKGKPNPRAALSPKGTDQIVNLARTQLKRRLIAFEGEIGP